jgi:phosphoribosyl 1,2-cyclic phosphodiesterase
LDAVCYAGERLLFPTPFWDRTLDLVALTHPDSDHITGWAPLLEWIISLATAVARLLPCLSENLATD